MYEYAAHRTQHIVQRPSYAHRTAHNTSRLGRFFSSLLFSPLLSSSLLFSPLLSSSLLFPPKRTDPVVPASSTCYPREGVPRNGGAGFCGGAW